MGMDAVAVVASAIAAGGAVGGLAMLARWMRRPPRAHDREVPGFSDSTLQRLR